MIALWMLSVIVFSACLAIASAAAETLSRALGRPARWIWTAALATAVLWPILAPLAALAPAQLRHAVTLLPAVSVLPEGGSLLAGAAKPTELAGRALLGLWAIASMLLIVRLVRALVIVRRLRARAEARVIDGVPVLLTDTLGPATIGLRRHAVIVPRSLLELEEPLRRLVLRHEREHCAARDPWLLLGAAIAVVLFPWNAALWFIARRLHLALEIDCDARVLDAGVEPTRYGRLLLLIAQRRGAIILAPMLAASPSHLERRIIAMRTRLARPRPVHLIVVGSLVVLALAGACSQSGLDAPLAQKSASTEPQRSLVRKFVKGPYYFEFQVETPVRQIPGTGQLRYPDDMRRAQREGEVFAEFVVDVNGVPEPATFKVIRSTDAAFTAAVATALPSMRFTPAVVGGAAVPQLVQQPFTFALTATR